MTLPSERGRILASAQVTGQPGIGGRSDAPRGVPGNGSGDTVAGSAKGDTPRISPRKRSKAHSGNAEARPDGS